MTSGVPAARLSDEDLRRDLLQLKKKQADIEQDGTADQKLNHHSRTTELEAEFVKRFGPGNEEADHDDADADPLAGTESSTPTDSDES